MQSVENIYVITNLFITNNYLLEMIRKIIFTNYFSEFIHQVAIKFRFRKTLQKKCFNPTLYLDTKSKSADKILKTPYEGYEIFMLV